MNVSVSRDFDAVLARQSKMANLPKDIIGKPFRFGCIHGSHHHILVGTVVGIQISDESGLELEVSNRSFWGMNLLGFYWDSDREEWNAGTEATRDGAIRRHYPGDMKFG